MVASRWKRLRWWKTASERAAEFVATRVPQGDQEFIADCGLPDTQEARNVALTVRKAVADMLMVEPQFLRASDREAIELRAVSDSVNFLEMVMKTEKALNARLPDKAFKALRPDYTVRDLVLCVHSQVTSNQPTKQQGQLSTWASLLLVIVLLPFLLLALALRLLLGLLLHIAIWCCWCPRGRDVLFVHSDSPVWHDYVEERILPRLAERAVVLNWSERGRWRPTLSVLAFRYLAGDRSYNPMAIVFRPFRLTRRFRFYEPFREFKHGKTEAVATMESELFDLLDQIDGRRPA